MPKDYQPETPEALLFLGFAASDAGHTQRAIQYWNALLTQMPPDAPMTRELKRIIEETKQKSARKKS
jgi:cytochrome c-type biogenesis protein CcmH/NrfG